MALVFSSDKNQRQRLRDWCITPRSCQGWGEVRASDPWVSLTQTLVSQGCLLVLFTVLFVVYFFLPPRTHYFSIRSPPTANSFVPLHSRSPSFPSLLLYQVLAQVVGSERGHRLCWRLSHLAWCGMCPPLWHNSSKPLVPLTPAPGSTACLLVQTFMVFSLVAVHVQC